MYLFHLVLNARKISAPGGSAVWAPMYHSGWLRTVRIAGDPYLGSVGRFQRNFARRDREPGYGSGHEYLLFVCRVVLIAESRSQNFAVLRGSLAVVNIVAVLRRGSVPCSASSIFRPIMISWLQNLLRWQKLEH
jgi:hypothetical protein